MQSEHFDPNAVAQENTGLFGLTYSEQDAKVVIIPAPWGVTVSYGGGTHMGPKAVADASPQIDYFHEAYGSESWKLPVALRDIELSKNVYERGLQLRKRAEKYIDALSNGREVDQTDLAEINVACEVFHTEIEQEALALLEEGKLVGLLGGDHSTPYGLMKALAKKHGDFGVLQVDAHCDLREAYEGFVYSHASIMWNALHTIPEITKLVQVGIRDYSPGEYELIMGTPERINTFFDTDLQNAAFKGVQWATQVEKIVSSLPKKVYISFDIDGLDPALCPNTGTPVPGGLSFSQAIYLIRAVSLSGRTVIGFDLNEVSPHKDDNEWNANVGMRVLWNLVLWSAKSNAISV
jgi:agmatinase